MEHAEVLDATLVEQTLAGDPTAFQMLVERYQKRLFALVRHYTQSAAEVEDIVQETFLKAYSRLSSFQQNSSFYTWIYRIAVNTILDLLKRRGRSPVQNVEDPEGAAGQVEREVARPESRLEVEEISEITHAVLAEIPEIFRSVLILREFDDRAYQEIADMLGISIGTVESRLFRARGRFKQKLTQMYPEFAG
ncbi:MAG: RNA polymerase sigma-70 factor (ECF subfamily) [Planctomycetota bacterium]|jgi:RNA polymerase sigma-70 factor (ECF subfamily)